MIVDHRHLTKELTGAQRRQHDRMRTVLPFHDLDLSGSDDETSRRRVPFADDELTGLIDTDASGFAEMLAILLTERCEQRGLGQQGRDSGGIQPTMLAGDDEDWHASRLD